MFERVAYTSLNACQKESFNFQKLAACPADYGFNCLWLNDDWQGADFIAVHIDGETFLKVQLKGRLTVDEKYVGKDVHVAFRHQSSWYLYPHDALLASLLEDGRLKGTASWDESGSYSWPTLGAEIQATLKPYAL